MWDVQAADCNMLHTAFLLVSPATYIEIEQKAQIECPSAIWGCLTSIWGTNSVGSKYWTWVEQSNVCWHNRIFDYAEDWPFCLWHFIVSLLTFPILISRKNYASVWSKSESSNSICRQQTNTYFSYNVFLLWKFCPKVDFHWTFQCIADIHKPLYEPS